MARKVFTTEVYDVIRDPEVDVIIEVMGGIEETKQYLIDALNEKKHVITANKDLMALYGSELLHVAKKTAVTFTMKQVSQVGFRFCVH